MLAAAVALAGVGDNGDDGDDVPSVSLGVLALTLAVAVASVPSRAISQREKKGVCVCVVGITHCGSCQV